ncbi:MAG: sigma-70 family RNA polymerase sigma factor [Acidimicrobiia bacterium]|nr:sigma-70 family RNA polymerase sigma factor [Acidimicrobiia bacterium]
MPRPPGVNEPNTLNGIPGVFEGLRPRLMGVAYGLLGSVAEAEDVVQEAWIRLQRTETGEIEDLTGWLITTTSRIAIDVLRSARKRREEYVGPWLPEPVETSPDPADRVSLSDSLSWAMLVVLETLTPAERAAFVLHDVFDLSFDEIGATLGRTPVACRKLASRARQHVESRKPRFEVDVEEHQEVVDAFADATESGDLESLVGLLDPGAVLTADGGGIVRVGKGIQGGEKIATYLSGFGRDPARAIRVSAVNNNPALVIFQDGRILGVAALGISQGRVATIDFVANPHKLSEVRPTPDP